MRAYSEIYCTSCAMELGSGLIQGKDTGSHRLRTCGAPGPVLDYGVWGQLGLLPGATTTPNCKLNQPPPYLMRNEIVHGGGRAPQPAPVGRGFHWTWVGGGPPGFLLVSRRPSPTLPWATSTQAPF
ncbi:hypothetical protein XELAEV_18038470mg [Xenopus laevis]|uniref:Uncharacterized protein n=1 Tax=Xenopus laevis TaxID=8355 RepID=A0A974H6Z9_XENLA|nr:hypothetical protein XELAEV_18038470mg [Xenopus laevis]